MTVSRFLGALGAFVLLSVGAGANADDAGVPTDPANIKPLKVGAQAPAFEVRRVDGSTFVFQPAKLDKPALLVFFRGGWCPYCNTHLSSLRKIESQLTGLGYDLLFFSADQPSYLYSSLKDPTIKFTILSDAKMNAARAFGIAFRVDDATVEQYKKFNVDLEKASGETHHQLPVPAVFVIDTKGVIRFVHANPDYRVRISNDDLLAAARAAASR